MCSNEELMEEIKKLNNKLNYIIPLINNPLKINYNDIPDPCKNCSNHPSNGGSGICHCILGQPKITC